MKNLANTLNDYIENNQSTLPPSPLPMRDEKTADELSEEVMTMRQVHSHTLSLMDKYRVTIEKREEEIKRRDAEIERRDAEISRLKEELSKK
jgi:hypothetical protein